ncbi:MAG: hypothetical protein AVDCRST_MAG07-2774, partial [uncultured Frankineae bacterium]
EGRGRLDAVHARTPALGALRRRRAAGGDAREAVRPDAAPGAVEPRRRHLGCAGRRPRLDRDRPRRRRARDRRGDRPGRQPADAARRARRRPRVLELHHHRRDRAGAAAGGARPREHRPALGAGRAGRQPAAAAGLRRCLAGPAHAAARGM